MERKLEKVQTGLGPIAVLNKWEVKDLLDYLSNGRDDIFEIMFAIDGGLKIKVNGLTWTAAMGKLYEQD